MYKNYKTKNILKKHIKDFREIQNSIKMMEEYFEQIQDLKQKMYSSKETVGEMQLHIMHFNDYTESLIWHYRLFLKRLIFIYFN